MRKHVRKAIIRHRQLQDVLEYAHLTRFCFGQFKWWQRILEMHDTCSGKLSQPKWTSPDLTRTHHTWCSAWRMILFYTDHLSLWPEFLNALVNKHHTSILCEQDRGPRFRLVNWYPFATMTLNVYVSPFCFHLIVSLRTTMSPWKHFFNNGMIRCHNLRRLASKITRSGSVSVGLPIQ